MTKHGAISKVPEITLAFWIIKILSTTLGETAGDTMSMYFDLGYLVSTGIFAVLFAFFVYWQIGARKFHPLLYWVTIITTTTLGTTLADFADRSLGIGYPGGSLLLLTLLLASLFAWYFVLGSISIYSVSSAKSEVFYWMTIMFSQTLGTALGDWTADSAGLGYDGGILIFSLSLAAIVVAYYRTTISRTILFWSAFILTRPLGAVVGDILDKPFNQGGLDLGQFATSAVLLLMISAAIMLFPQKAASSGH